MEVHWECKAVDHPAFLLCEVEDPEYAWPLAVLSFQPEVLAFLEARHGVDKTVAVVVTVAQIAAELLFSTEIRTVPVLVLSHE